VSFIRRVKSVANLRQTRIFAKGTDLNETKMIALVEKLTRVRTEGTDESHSPGVKFSTEHYDCWLDIDEAELKKAATKLEETAKDHQELIKRLRARLSNKSYLANAPKELVDETKDALAQAEAELEDVEQELKALKS
jgi:valyl-tRNA synthetase